MSLDDRRVPTRQSHEAFCEIIDTVVAPQECDLADRAIGQWRLGVEPQPMVAELRVVDEVEGCICDASVLRGAPHSKVAFTPVEPLSQADGLGR
jgi:hypothetical protein